jgi:hypothetical protein
VRSGAVGAVRALALLVSAAAFAAAMAFARPAVAGDPYLDWYTVRTPHFRVHYHGGLETLAQRTASLAEAIRARLAVPLARPPDDITHVLLSDTTDSANGSAAGVPYNAVRLFVTAPEDLSPLDDYDDWMVELLTHEMTHVFHIDTMGWFPKLLNGILGKTYAPNQVQPHWILEGLAVAMESQLTSGGRVRSTLFDMYLRADVLEHNLAGLDQMSHDVRRWPGGDIWYLYGGKFFAWIHETYGPDVFAAVASDYGANLIPWQLNRAIKRATGRTYPELYAGWVRALEDKYAAQANAVREHGLRVGTRLTFAGHAAFSPRFVPPCARRGSEEELLYHRDDGHSPAGFYRLALVSRSHAAPGDSEIVARSNGSPRTASFDPRCGMVFDSEAPSARLHDWDDLHYQPPGTTSSYGALGTRDRWTTSLRARAPDVSPDGRQIVFATNHAGTTTLRIADIRPEGGLANTRRLVPSAAGEQAFTPRFSPDGRRVAYSAWTKGGYRDVRVVDVATGAFFELSHDRASDVQPTFTPDGRHVLFSSDRTGIANIYAFEIATGRVSQITNVLTGAFMPEVSPDGRTLVYVGYTSAGFDLFSLPLAEKEWVTAVPARVDRPEPPPEPPHLDWPVEPYDPWVTMRPHNFTLDYGGGNFGNTLIIGVGGSDIVGNHGLFLSLREHPEIGQLSGSLSYSYSRLPVALSMSAFRSLAPRAPLAIDGRNYPVRDETLGISTGISYSMPGEFDAHSVSLSYTAATHHPTYAIGAANDPYTDTLSRPADSFLGSVRVGWRYGNAYRPLYGISSERGVTLTFSTDFAGPATGGSGDGTLYAVEARATGYLLAPWFSHHVFALALSGGSAGGSFARNDYYYKGGFVDADAFGAITSGIRQNGFVLRGYAPSAFFGRQYNLANLEYRFPIAWFDRGVSTLPFLFHGMSGTLFADYGGAYDKLAVHDPLGMYHLGVGGEISMTFVLGYFIETGLRVGWAKGLSDGAVSGSQTYAVLAASF